MTVDELRSALQGSQDRLFLLLRGMDEEQFRFVPAGEQWCIATHLAHLWRVERVFVERARAALTQDEPAMPSTGAVNDDDPGLAQHLAVPQIIHGLQAARRELDELLTSCDERQIERAIQHERLGRMTVEAIATKMAQHDDEHAVQIARLVPQAPTGGRVIIPLTRRS
jgi:DinB superfamily